MSSPTESSPAAPGFTALAPAVQRALSDLGYEAPTPIQAAALEPLLDGRDVLGQAQTGTGKTAAFALPILSHLNPKAGAPQALVLAPTRELAIQVAEAFQSYAAHIGGFRVLPIYGGTAYQPQLQGLRRGVHVVVGTPGRVIDHLEKGTLDLSSLRFVVLDEADEMLRMGFAEDVDKILSSAPEGRQTALFSATMPAPIRRIAKAHLNDPVEVSIAAKTTTAPRIRQRYWLVSGVHKLDALTRILEAEPFDAMLVFARTRQSSDMLVEKLQARGFNAAAIHGDIVQARRERLIRQLRDGQIDILVATDVAARGLDVERISHVLNFDIPYDTESYVHRIGRTGRAGREGEAILFVTPRERGMLRAIERATRQPIEPMQLPTVDDVNDRRIQRFMQKVQETLDNNGLEPFRDLVQRFEHEHDIPAIDIAAALAKMAHGNKPLLLKARDNAPSRESGGRREPLAERHHEGEQGKDTWRLDVGHVHGVEARNIIGAIANESGMDSQHIGRLTIHDNHSLIDLPEGMPDEMRKHLKKVRVGGRPLRIKLNDDLPSSEADAPPAKPAKRRPADKPRKGTAKRPRQKTPRSKKRD